MTAINKVGSNLKQYEGVIIRNSVIGNDVVLGTDAYIQNANLGNCCKIERRGMVFDSEIGDYSYTGYNTVTKDCQMGRFCSVSWNVSIGGANHNYKRFSTFPFAMRNLVGGGGGLYILALQNWKRCLDWSRCNYYEWSQNKRWCSNRCWRFSHTRCAAVCDYD